MNKKQLIGLAFSALVCASAQAEIEYELSAGAHSHYVWRGKDQGGGQLIDTSLTAATKAGGFDLYANLWYATTGDGGVDELDITLAAEKDFGFATVGAGFIRYAFPDTSGDTSELFLGLSRDLGLGVEGSLTYYKDVDLNDKHEGYLEAGLSKELNFFGDSFAPTLDLTVGFDADVKKFTHYQATLSHSFKLNETATVTPYVSYSKADSLTRDEFFGGASISVSF